ncbi:membrane protein [Streptomyces sp. WM6373]|nr:membrane protein [Streptomyces sp. WM6373]KOU75328.1 membrane protein [Streptomyces sp. XY66]KOU76663.1 membrane protein [Streptomyces sp. IGB124]KOU98590.1 membrane protein [Streptomyces sp. XY58]KOV07777.1 membrane protein [Streptomyces sp. XY37]KOV22767.1 membrane protein [Streptomyces sp. XY413]KOV43196.1 membrane protein [Streptomyces sp. MMG1064]
MRRAIVLLAGTPVLAALVYAPAPQAEAAQASSVDVQLVSMAPSAPVKGDTLTIEGTVVNTGSETITDAHVGLRVGPALTDRSSIDETAERNGFRAGTDPGEIDPAYAVKIDSLPSKVTQNFTLTVPVNKLELDKDGVYQLGVSLSGVTDSRPSEQVLGIKRTFLPWQPDAAAKRSQLTYAWPLISTTRVTAETGSDELQTPVFLDDSLYEELKPGGRLEQMVTLGKDLPITWVIDPDLLYTVDAMTKGYRVRGANGKTVQGKNKAVAEQWLSSLEAAVQGKKVVALPFADPDLASLAHHGKDVSGTLGQLRPATDKAKQAVETVLHVPASTDFSWPVNGAIDPSIVNVATSAGAHNVLTRSDSLVESGALGYTPSAARPIGAGTTAVVADAELSTAFEGDMLNAGSSTLAVQRFLAHSLALNLQKTDEPRSFVVAPQRMPTVSQARSMAAAIRGLQGGRWTQPADLEAAAAAKPDPGATTQVPGAGQYPEDLRKQELPVSAFEKIRTTQNTLDHFKVILAAPDRVEIPFGNTVNREMSTSWRGRPDEARLYRDQVQEYLIGLTEKVKVIPKSDATLSGHSATIPVSVQNSLVQDVHDLVLRVKSANPSRLMFNGSGQAEQQVTVQGDHTQTVKFPANATASGPVEVTAQLFTKDGIPYGKERRFTVEATEITPTVMLVIAGGVLLLVLAGIKMYASRKRVAARAAAEESTQPSDESPDTEPQSTEGSGTSETVDR